MSDNAILPSNDLLRCPDCGGELDPALRCELGHRCSEDGGILDFLRASRRSDAAEGVSAFYDAAPFPGYAPDETADSLLLRSRRSPFLAALERSIAPDARIADVGCGTGQLAAFLALASGRRTVFAVDACRASLCEAARFQRRVRVPNLRLVRADLFALPLAANSFDVVISRGVVHHTEDPAAAIEAIAAQVRPGGVLALAFYENVARFPHAVRRAMFGRSPRALRWVDPLLRREERSEEKERIWLKDQYEHPLERMLSAPRVLAHLEAQGFEWVRSVPPIVDEGSLFEPTPRPGRAGWLVRRLHWLLRGFDDADCGVVFLMATKR